MVPGPCWPGESVAVAAQRLAADDAVALILFVVVAASSSAMWGRPAAGDGCMALGAEEASVAVQLLASNV